MNKKQYHSLSDICAGSYNWIVKVRIVRSWRGVSNKGEAFKGLNLLLLDDKDCRIHAFVPGNIIDNHEDKLLEGNICSISNFSVKDYKSDEKFRCINSDKQIMFTTYTEVKKFDEDDSLIANNIFDFYDLADLSLIANDNTHLTDVIGVIEKDLPLAHLVNRFGHQQTQIKITIVDGRSSVNVTFWDSLAEEFEIALNNVTIYPVIIIIASAKITSWQGTKHNTPQLEISNVTATRFYLNYDHHDVINLRRMLHKPMFAKYNFTNPLPEKINTFSIAEIRHLGIDYIEKEVICGIKVTSVFDTTHWFFYQCSSCFKIIEPNNGIFHCYRCCDRIVPHPYKNWCFSIEAEDHSGNIEIVLMDREARTILGIYAPSSITQDEETIPEVVKTMVNKYYTVKLQIKRANVEEKSFTYVATGIFQTPANESNSQIDESRVTDAMQVSVTQASGSSIHLDDFSQLNFHSPELNKKGKKKRTLTKKQ